MIDVGQRHALPGYTCVKANAHALARYAALCQDENIVPIVEPEVLMDGDHDIDRCAEVTTWMLKETFQELFFNRVALEGMVLKPNMAVPGKKSQNARPSRRWRKKRCACSRPACRRPFPASHSSRAASPMKRRPRILTP